MGEKSYQLSAFRRQIRSVGLFSVVSHSAFGLFILRVGWFECSETQRKQSYQLSAIRRQIRTVGLLSSVFYSEIKYRRRHFSAELEPFLQLGLT